MIKKSLLITSWIVACLFSLTAFAQEKIVISQVYGGGGNAGATYTHDFIELFNRDTAPVSLSGLSLQYASATGTGNFGANSGQLTVLPNITLQPGQYFLVQQAGGTVGTALPTPDATGNIGMAAGAGKVVLVTGTTSLGCNGGSAPCSADATARIIDLAGYGTGSSGANYFEGNGAAPTLNATTAAIRADKGCTDSNNNNTDFTTAAPAPRNTASPLNACGAVTPVNPSAIASANPATVAPGAQTLFRVTVTPGTNPASSAITVSGDLSSVGGSTTQPLFDDGSNGDATAGDNIFSLQATVAANTTTGAKVIPFIVTDAQSRTASATTNLTVQSSVAITPIYTIQSSSSASPLAGQTLTTQGVVVGDFQATGQLNGFFIQDATGDGDTTTSDGIFVLSSTAVSVGQIVKVTGPVREEFNQTQIGKPGDNVVVEVQTDNATIKPSVIRLPVSSTGVLEQYEGMLVSFSQVLTVSQNFTLARFGELVLSAGLDYPFNEADGRLYNPTNFIDPTDSPASGVANTTDNKAAVVMQQNLHTRSTILLDDGSSVQNPAVIPYLGPDNTLRVGSTVNNLTGILNYAFNVYRLQPTVAPAFTYAPRPLTPPSTGNANLKIASFNVLNYFVTFGGRNDRGASNSIEFNRQRNKIIAALKVLNADVVGLIEMQNNGDGTTSAIADLVRGLNEATAAGTYDYIRDAANGGTGTDAIKVAFIYKPAKVTPVGAPMADFNSVHNRPPLAQSFRLSSNEEVFTAVINHFKSKSGTGTGLNADQGDGQGNFNQDRVDQAKALVAFINNTVIPAVNDSDVIILGDLNAYAEEDPMDVLRAAGFESLFGAESYSYVFDSQSGSLDHALVTPGLKKQFTEGGKWHINADEPIFLDYNTEFKTPAQVVDLYASDAFRSSDHDPVLVGLKLFSPAISFAEATTTIGEGMGSYTVNLSLSEKTYQPTTVTIGVTTAGASSEDFSTTPALSTNTITLTIPAESMSASFTLTVTDDRLDELDEKITFTINEVSSGLKKGDNTATIITIEDNDVPVVSFGQSAATRNEGSGAYTVTLQTDITPVVALSVPVAIRSARDVRYGEKRDFVTSPDGSTGSINVIIPAGEMHGVFTVTPQADDDNEKDPENVLFTLQSGNNYTLGEQTVFTFTILDVKKNTSLKEMMLTLWPNPTSGVVNIVTQMQNEIMEVILHSPEGEVIFTGKGNAADLSRQISNALQSRRGGLYHLQMIIADEVRSTRILKF